MRVVHGAVCSWWDSIDKVGTAAGGLPVCPHCGGPLFEIDSEEDWLDGARQFEERGNPGYVAFLTWLRGRCYRGAMGAGIAAARAAYDQHLLGDAAGITAELEKMRSLRDAYKAAWSDLEDAVLEVAGRFDDDDLTAVELREATDRIRERLEGSTS